MSVLDRQLLSHVERTVAGLGYVLVDLERAGGGLLRVTIERPDAVPQPGVMSDAGITVDDCERVSHQLTHLFAVENVDYERLEVGSPGVDRPLVKAQDFARFAGALVKVSLLAPVDGVRKLTGRIVGVEAEQVTVELIDPSELPEAKKQLPRSPSKRGAKKAESAPRQRVRFSVKDVDKARVVPELNFRSGRS